MNKYVSAALVALALLAGIYLYQKYRIAPGIQFDALELTDLAGKPVRLSDYRGKKLFINFFATWCGPCVGEFPSLDHAAETLMPDNFLFIAISDESFQRLNAFNNRMGANHVILLRSSKTLHSMGVFTVPTNYLLNSGGKVVFEQTDVLDWADAQVLEKLKQKAQ